MIYLRYTKVYINLLYIFFYSHTFHVIYVCIHVMYTTCICVCIHIHEGIILSAGVDKELNDVQCSLHYFTGVLLCYTFILKHQSTCRLPWYKSSLEAADATLKLDLFLGSERLFSSPCKCE